MIRSASNNLRNILTGCALAIIAMAAPAEEIIILHTNDTHSALDPDDKNLGGVLRRKVLIDSIRQERLNTNLMILPNIHKCQMGTPMAVPPVSVSIYASFY